MGDTIEGKDNIGERRDTMDSPNFIDNVQGASSVDKEGVAGSSLGCLKREEKV